tara:strand:- start:230 stop:1780 length:1551 start_codon:yes stop_codon:yes gene_type:complete
MSATESFLSQLEKAASGQSLDFVEFSTMLEDVEVNIEDPIEDEIVEEVLVEEEEPEIIEEVVPEIVDVNVQHAMSELQSLFEGISGITLEEKEENSESEIIAEEEIIEEEIEELKPEINIDPAVLEEAAQELKGLFSSIAGVDLFAEKKIEPEIIEEEKIEPLTIEDKYYNLPIVTPKYEISDISKALIGHASSVMNKNITAKRKYNVEIYNPTVSQGEANWQMDLFANEKNGKMAKMVNDVATLLEKHRGELPEEEYRILEGNAVDQTVDYLNRIAISEQEEDVVSSETSATAYQTPEFESRVGAILRKVLSNVGWGQQGMLYGSGEVRLKRLDDVDATNINATKKFLAWDTSVNKFVASEGGAAGDITGVVTGVTSGLSGGVTTGTATLQVDISRLTELSAEAATTDYVMVYDVDASTTKKLLISNLPGDIQSITAGTGLSGGGTSGDVTIDLDTVAVTSGGTGIITAAKGSVLVANAADTFSALEGSTDGDVLTYNAGTDTISWEGSVDGGTY